MKKNLLKSVIIIVIIASYSFLTGCAPTDNTEKLWDENGVASSEQHEIDSIYVLNTGTDIVSGVSKIRIVGKKFPINKDDITVYFGSIVATVDNYSTTAFDVKLPLITNSLLMSVKIAKKGVASLASYNFATNSKIVVIGAKDCFEFTDEQVISTSIALDESGNIFTPLFDSKSK